METWIWISLWIVQTIAGAVLWRKFMYDRSESVHEVLFLNALLLINIFIVIVLLFKSIGYLYNQLCYFIDYLAGVKNKTENDNI